MPGVLTRKYYLDNNGPRSADPSGPGNLTPMSVGRFSFWFKPAGSSGRGKFHSDFWCSKFQGPIIEVMSQGLTNPASTSEGRGNLSLWFQIAKRICRVPGIP